MHVMKRGKATSSVSVNTRFSLPNNNNGLGQTSNQSVDLYDVNIEITLHRTRIIYILEHGQFKRLLRKITSPSVSNYFG